MFDEQPILKPDEVLKQYWGYDSFRPQQELIVHSVMEGKDVLTLLPTGGGKSICFQVPGLCKPGITLVISPLIALMKDQVSQLNKLGIRASAIYSGMTQNQIDITLDNCIYGNQKFLYVSPERILTELFQERVIKMNVNLVAVDEAHCISLWGYDFRPPYLEIANLRELLPYVNFIALTATATKQVQDEIVQKLAFRNPAVFTQSFARTNLSYSVRRVFEKEKLLLKILNKVQGSSIVYVNSRKECRVYSDFLNKNNISSDFYHAGLSSEEREKKQIAWINDHTRVMVSTNAFGMGIDKSNVRSVLHMHIPSSPEAYYQEAGRAGRDGLKSYSVILCNENDSNFLAEQFEKSHPSPQLIEKVYQSIANYLQVAAGEVSINSFNFNLSAFCNQFNFDPLEAYYCIQILEQEGILRLNESLQIKSKLYFNVNRQDLYHFQIEQSKFDPIIKTLLRVYGGELFQEYIPIKEANLAKLLSVDEETIVRYLRSLYQLNIVDYIERKDQPQLSFVEMRYDSKHLPMNFNLLKARKGCEKEKSQTMVSYVENTQRCRNQILLEYFGELTYVPCELCDTCISKKKIITTTHHDAYKHQILEKLKKGPAPIESLETAIDAEDSSLIETVIKEMLDQGLIAYNEHWELILLP